ncbi:hypothetical protein OZX57_05595 [Bifidobacterium sp. ESL0682]|nr:hypothetical protein [Bifidobacterium sp. ESL0682]WEV41507.1 hypothetical protein OZX57_05595 [Bifidobacterium sp. ESL0682]
MNDTILPQFHLQTLSFLRNGKSVFFTLAFPVALALLFGLAYKGDNLPLGGEHRFRLQVGRPSALLHTWS